MEEGDLNTKFFHALVNRKRRKLNIQRIKDQSGQWIEDEDQIAKEAVTSYENLFTENNHDRDIRSLDCIQSVISEQENDHLIRMPDIVELKDIVFSLNPNSTPGLDGVTAGFYQDSWDIIA